jgi:hypothetical protein
LFDCAGAVHLYQAENYLILQNPTTDTFWWDGVSELVRSPGMNEQDWAEPEVPVFEMEVVAPEADIPDCDIDGLESGIEVRFLVIDHATEQPIDDVVWTVKRNGSRAYHGLSGLDGRFSFNPRPRVYAYDLRKAGYTAIEDVALQIDGAGVERSWDDCLPPTIEMVGEYDFVVRMYPVTYENPCGTVNQSLIYDIDDNVITTQRRVSVTNDDDAILTLLAVNTGSPSIAHNVVLPVTIAPGDTLDILVTGAEDLAGMTISLAMDCVDSPVEIVLIGNCSYVIEYMDVVTLAGPGCTGVFVVRNTGDSVLTITSYNGPGFSGAFFPYTIPAGEFQIFMVFYSDEFLGQPFTFTTLECGVSSVYYWPSVCNPSDDYFQEHYFPE